MYSAVAIFQVVDAPPWPFVADQFGFEQRVERLGVGETVGVQAGYELPAPDTTGEHIDRKRRVNPTGERPDVGDVGNPKSIRGGPGEPTFDQVRRPVHQRPWDCHPGSFGSTDTAKALPFHQPFDRATGDLVAVPTQLGVNFPNPVNIVVERVDLVNLLGQDFLGQDLIRQGSLQRRPSLHARNTFAGRSADTCRPARPANASL
jgi:hypothetical protein